MARLKENSSNRVSKYHDNYPQCARALQHCASPGSWRLHQLASFNDALFDANFKSEGINIILTPYCAPNANAYAERWVRTARTECLDLILILNVAHLRRVLQVYIDDYYNAARPHQATYTNSTKTACQHWYCSTAKSVGRHH